MCSKVGLYHLIQFVRQHFELAVTIVILQMRKVRLRGAEYLVRGDLAKL